MSSAKIRAVACVYGVVCTMLFAVSVATMIVMMLFGMTRSVGPLHAPLSWLANGVLLLQFPLAHSLLLSARGRTIVRRLAPLGLGAHLAASTYVIVASAQVLLLFTMWSPTGTIWWRADGPGQFVIWLMYAGAWALLLKALFDAGISLQSGYLGWGALLKNAQPVYPKMPTSGLFRFCRQPIYLAFTLTLWTVPIWTPDQLVLATVLTAYCLIGPLFKELRFRRQFGEEFEAFGRRTPYWLPWPRPLATTSEPSICDQGDDAWCKARRGLPQSNEGQRSMSA